jgi:hypothetical protein
MASATLAIGSAGYELLDFLDNGDPNDSSVKPLSATKSGTAYSIRSKNAGIIENLGINNEDPTGVGSLGKSNISIFSNLENFQAALGSGADTLNVSGNVQGGEFELDDSTGIYSDPYYSGADLLSITGNLDSDGSEYNRIFAGGGNDTIRISKNVENAFIYLGDGNDSLSIGGTTKNADIHAGAGNDYLDFSGEAGSSSEGVRVQAGDDNDTVIFRNRFEGSGTPLGYSYGDTQSDQQSDPGNSSVELGDGRDSLVLGKGAKNVQVNTGNQSDTISLAGNFEGVSFNLDGVSTDRLKYDFQGGDRLSSANRSEYLSSTFSSNNASGDTLIFGSTTNFTDSSIYLGTDTNYSYEDSYGNGAGKDSLVFGSSSGFDNTHISTGWGADTIVFGINSTFNNLSIDLGDDVKADIIKFAANSDLTGVTVTGASSNDVLWIGSTRYAANEDYWKYTT